jgi:hypothetical protein
MKWQQFSAGAPDESRRVAFARRHAGHLHTMSDAMSRRRFLRQATGAAALGATVGPGLMRPLQAVAAGPGVGLAEPIPTTVEFFPGVQSHVLAPPVLFGPDSDPSTVYNFEGATGISFTSGQVERRDRRTGGTETLPFSFNDMRFMKGRFRGRDGHVRNATFAFI